MQQEPIETRRPVCCGKIWRYVLIALGALIVLRAIYLFGILPASYEIAQPAATATTACPTTDTVKGSSSYETAPSYKTRKGARDAATALLQGRADTEAGLARNGYSCPNPACQNKTLGPVTATPNAGFPKGSITVFSVIKSALDFFQTTYYSGEMEYDWSATITCQ